MKYVVIVYSKGNKFWLRGTTWAFRLERCDVFDSKQLAEEAAKRVEKFMSPRIRKTYRIEELT